jgi:hypothetical protein
LRFEVMLLAKRKGDRSEGGFSTFKTSSEIARISSLSVGFEVLASSGVSGVANSEYER